MSAKKHVLETVREQDYVEYYLFPNARNVPANEEQFLQNLLAEINSFAKKLCKHYIWHVDEFQLKIRTSTAPILITNNIEEDQLPLHLFGVTHYGENIEDEWFIVYLLLELSKSFPDLIIRAIDSDGEFLLIEAANFLPNWATPESCNKRVYIHSGKLHIVAPNENNDDEAISVKQSVDIVRTNPNLTVASPSIQAAISKKIADYPQKISLNLHRTKAFVPVSIAAILQHNPKLISPAVLAFCNRDTIDLKICRAMKYFPPEDCVYTSITFTKFLYALVKHSKYLPDQKSGWKFPSPLSNAKTHFQAHELGVKIACGFEILANQSNSNENTSWEIYLDNLKANNYFQDNLEDSLAYKSLLDKAREHFQRSCTQTTPENSSLGQEILKLSRSLDADAVRCDVSSLPDDDSDEWLNISSEDLDDILTQQYGAQEKTLLSNASNANEFGRKLEQFLTQKNSFEGVEYRAEGLRKEKRVDFDADKFSNAVESILSLVIPEDDAWHEESDSDMDEYGDEVKHSSLSDCEKEKMDEYIRKMDEELAQTTIGESFAKTEQSNEDFNDVEHFQSVDIDVNALKNILKSYKAQMGEAGPSSTMLGPMGIHLENSAHDSD